MNQAAGAFKSFSGSKNVRFRKVPVKDLYVETPCMLSSPLSQILQREVYLKLENFQPSHSFKLRGIGRLCVDAAKGGSCHFVSSSAGNAGLAAAYSGRLLNIHTTVYLPNSTPVFMRERIALEGAAVVVAGDTWDEAHASAMKAVGEEGAFYIPPFDHPTIWAGNSTLVDELKTQMPKPSLIIASIGGGGLISGILEGLNRHNWSDIPVLACETEGTASFAATLRARKLITLPKISGVATSIGVKTVSAKMLEWIDSHPLRSFVTSDRSAVSACISFLDDHKMLVDPACGAALASIYQNELSLNQDGPVLVVVCGGAVINLESLNVMDAAL